MHVCVGPIGAQDMWLAWALGNAALDRVELDTEEFYDGIQFRGTPVVLFPRVPFCRERGLCPYV